ncbi:ABC transporter substrate-binding protein [Neptunitalea chrysea]|nr:ABC transporter substrate-binding protein [Neptunitalea chrysea]
MKKFKGISRFLLLLFTVAFVFGSCKEKQSEPQKTTTDSLLKPSYAKGFYIEKKDGYTLLKVTKPWPHATKTFTYALVPKGNKKPDGNFDAVVTTPVSKIVATSTTYIPSLEALQVENTLVGFPDTQYISSPNTRKMIEEGKIKELGANESINTELVIDINPDVIIGFSINDQNKTYATIQKTGIPVVYNGDWAEETPLGKAEWIKFFAPFFNKEKEADSIFNYIEKNYLKAKQLVAERTEKPTVLCGAMYKDVWYLPGGKSWMAQFLADANTNYLWKNTDETGSLKMTFESVYDMGVDADFWIAPGQFIAYNQLTQENNSYKNFKAFKNKKIYTFSNTKGPTGGLLYYEMAPSRPDLVLKDIIYYLHPDALENYTPHFFKTLE